MNCSLTSSRTSRSSSSSSLTSLSPSSSSSFVHNQQKTKGGWRSGLAREEEAWLKKKEKFDKMMAEEKKKVTRRKLIKALVDVEEEMDSIKKQIFGGQLKPDLERQSLN